MSEPRTKTHQKRPADADAVINDLTESLRETARAVVPWFLKNMPLMYFQDTSPAEQLSHLRPIIAAKASGRPIELTLRADDGSHWTLMRPLNRPGVLAEMVHELPHGKNLRAAKIHTAEDGNLVLVTFVFGEPKAFDPTDPAGAAKLAETIAYAAARMPEFEPDEIRAHFARCDADYLLTLTPLRICRQWQIYRQIAGTDGALVSLEDEDQPGVSRIVVTIENARTRLLLERISGRLSHYAINIQRAYLDNIVGPHGEVNTMGFVVEAPGGGAIDPKSDLWTQVRKDIQRLKWTDAFTLELSTRHPGMNLRRAEIILALAHLTHQVLIKLKPHAFDRDRIVRHLDRNPAHVNAVIDLFLERFRPESPLSTEAFKTACTALRHRIDSEIDLETGREFFNRLVGTVESVLRTNVFLENRYALAMRIDPKLLQTEERPELPYGVFFVHGRSFNAFHVRFRDIARGGVRAVKTIGMDQHSREIERLYDEAYGLAFAQQLKNKDIPEGGAKAVILLEPDTPVDRCVKAFVDGMLDLITPDEATRSRVVDLFPHPELLYLGPDENITPELIDWIVARAERRGYATPTALMSSKAGAGINHKTYGVTSEGVTVFLDCTLRHVGIDPTKRPFTIKITGGPDGDVAGNEIKILHREYGENARIVGIADGFGCAEDPDGLDHQELLRLVEASRPIVDFDRARLGPNGRLTTIEEPEGVQLRNTMHNRVISDAFVPAGGRPATIHGDNWRDFLQPDGRPASAVIVEGANLFLTPSARRALAEHGVLIIKDSSANKCGVICSSYEITACLLLDSREFLEIKEIFVQQILVKLRELARREAVLLLRMNEHRHGEPLFQMSVSLSRVIIRAADIIERAIDTLEAEDAELMHQLVLEHLPEILTTTVGDRIWTRMPRSYLRWIMAKSLAARVVYREGYEALENMPDASIARLAVQYLRQEKERRTLAADVRASDLPNRDRIASLLERSGILPTLGGSD